MKVGQRFTVYRDYGTRTVIINGKPFTWSSPTWIMKRYV